MENLKSYRLRYILTALALLSMFGLATKAEAYSSIASRKNGVTVDVKPVQFVSGKPVRFEVRMNTHSVDLGQDMKAVSILKDDKGREYQPVSWEGSGPGGHHRSGVLEFPAIDGNPGSVTLVIKDIAGVERVFEWKAE